MNGSLSLSNLAASPEMELFRIVMDLLYEPLAIFLFSMGALLLFIDLRTKLDKSFRFFGASLIMLSMMVSIDFWIIAKSPGAQAIANANTVYHLLAVAFIMLSTRYVSMLSRYEGGGTGFIVAAGLLIAMLFAGGMMIHPGGKQGQATIWYLVVFCPYVVHYVLLTNAMILKGIRRSAAPERRQLVLQLCGFALLFLFGILDILVVVRLLPQLLHSWTFFGILAFGLISVWLFSERLLWLLRENREMEMKLREAYVALSREDCLRELGRSSAYINHEIKNYAACLRGNIKLIRDGEKDVQKLSNIQRIENATARLEEVSGNILDFVGTATDERRDVHLVELIADTLASSFPGERGRIRFDKERSYHAYCDASKIRTVAMNLVRNSLEANASVIDIRFASNERVVVLVIEDDGIGCLPDDLEKITTPFFTTKANLGGVGLGMSICKAILENHGGGLFLFSKNSLGEGQRGLLANVVLPIKPGNERDSSYEAEIAVVCSEGGAKLSEMLGCVAGTGIVANGHITSKGSEKAAIILGEQAPRKMPKWVRQDLPIVIVEPVSFRLLDGPFRFRSRFFSPEFIVGELCGGPREAGMNSIIGYDVQAGQR